MPFKWVKNDLEINLNTFLYAVLSHIKYNFETTKLWPEKMLNG